jgi:aspartyl-tRNA(Asn)/glutamyl-tRNA(Gln) amidotransferase subunit B
VEARNLAQVSDEGMLESVVAQILKDNPKEVASYLAGKESVFQWMMGQVARLTRGKADPQVARQLLMAGLEKIRKNQ